MVDISIAKPEHRGGILYLHPCPYAFVRDDHDVICYLARNKDLIGCNIHEQIKVDGCYYKICTKVLNFVLKMLAKYDVTRLQAWIRATGLERIRKKRQEMRVAVAMCLHPRLGQNSKLNMLGRDLVALVVSKIKDVEEDRLRCGRIVSPAKHTPEPILKARYITGTALVWTNLSQMNLNDGPANRVT